MRRYGCRSTSCGRLRRRPVRHIRRNPLEPILLRLHMSQTVRLVPSAREDIKGNFTADGKSEPVVSKLLAQNLDKFSTQLMFLHGISPIITYRRRIELPYRKPQIGPVLPCYIEFEQWLAMRRSGSPGISTNRAHIHHSVAEFNEGSPASH